MCAMLLWKIDLLVGLHRRLNNQFDVRMSDYILILFNINIILELVVQQSRSLELIFSRMAFLYVLLVCVRDPLLRS